MVDLPYDPTKILPADAPLDEQIIYGGTDSAVGNAATQRVNAPMVNSGLEATLSSQPQTLNPQQQKLTDAERLDRQRRRMIMFGAIADAGAALQGRDGKMVANLFDYFNSQDEDLRKAAASERELSLREELVNSLGAAPLGEGASQIDMLEAEKARLMKELVLNPEMVEVYKVRLADIDKEIERLRQIKIQTQQTVQGADIVMSNIQRLAEEVEANPSTTGMIGSILGAFRSTKAGSLRLDLETVKANIAFDTLRGIKAGGATLGAVSAPELALLEAKISQLSMDRPQEDVLRSFRAVQEYYQQIIRNA